MRETVEQTREPGSEGDKSALLPYHALWGEWSEYKANQFFVSFCMSSLATSGLDAEGSEQTATRTPLIFNTVRLQCQQSLNMCPDVHVVKGA